MGLFEKEEWTEPRKEWVIRIGNSRIPFQVIRVIFTIVCIALAYNIGQHDAQEYIKFLMAYHDTCDMRGTCTHCDPLMVGNTVQWECKNFTMNKTTNFSLIG